MQFNSPENIPENCPSCKVPYFSSHKFCSHCGAELPAIEPIAEPENNSEEQVQPRPATSKLYYSGFIYASFRKRLLAYIIDLIVIFTSFYIIEYLFRPSNSSNIQVFIEKGLSTPYYYLCWWLYFSIMESSPWQATLGKQKLGLRVCNRRGERINFLHAATRQLCGILSVLSFSSGYIMAIFSTHKQALHDYLASTLVVNQSTPIAQIAMVNQTSDDISPKKQRYIPIGLLLLVLIALSWNTITSYTTNYTKQHNLQKQLSNNHQLQKAILEHYQKNAEWPTSLQQLSRYTIVKDQSDFRFVITTQGSYQQIFFNPSMQGVVIEWRLIDAESSQYRWQCRSDTIELKLLPKTCRNSAKF